MDQAVRLADVGQADEGPPRPQDGRGGESLVQEQALRADLPEPEDGADHRDSADGDLPPQRAPGSPRRVSSRTALGLVRHRGGDLAHSSALLGAHPAAHRPPLPLVSLAAWTGRVVRGTDNADFGPPRVVGRKLTGPSQVLTARGEGHRPVCCLAPRPRPRNVRLPSRSAVTDVRWPSASPYPATASVGSRSAEDHSTARTGGLDRPQKTSPLSLAATGAFRSKGIEPKSRLLLGEPSRESCSAGDRPSTRRSVRRCSDQSCAAATPVPAPREVDVDAVAVEVVGGASDGHAGCRRSPGTPRR